MSTVTIPRPDVTTEDVAAALRKGLGPRYQVQPGMRTSLLPGAARSRLARLHRRGHRRRPRLPGSARVDRRDGRTRIRVHRPG